MRVHADSRTRREHRARNRAGARPEITLTVLSVDPALDRVSVDSDAVLTYPQPLTLGDRELFRDEIEPCDRFRNRMLDLDACVHLEKIELLSHPVHEKFDGAGASIAQPLGEPDRGFMHRRPQLGRQIRRGGFFDQFLIPPLDRAVAVAKMYDIIAVA